MVKIYVVDTNVLIQAPYAIESFEDNEVVLPMVVIEELDHLKKAEGEVGMNARRSIRCLEQLRQKADLLTGVQMENGGRLRRSAGAFAPAERFLCPLCKFLQNILHWRRKIDMIGTIRSLFRNK